MGLVVLSQSLFAVNYGYPLNFFPDNLSCNSCDISLFSTLKMQTQLTLISGGETFQGQ